METQTYIYVATGLAIHLIVFWMIVGKALIDKEFRRETINLPVWVILAIGFLWPLTLIGIGAFVVWLYNRAEKDN